jgi:excinuclease ABC subunit C
LQRIRDEAHRFAIAFHRKLRGKALVASKLDQIIGIGEIRRAALLKKFGTMERIAKASEEEFRELGINPDLARTIRAMLSG